MVVHLDDISDGEADLREPLGCLIQSPPAALRLGGADLELDQSQVQAHLVLSLCVLTRDNAHIHIVVIRLSEIREKHRSQHHIYDIQIFGAEALERDSSF